jgi:uncharacterized protein YdhG (YjbR/CyaY superfamily)
MNRNANNIDSYLAGVRDDYRPVLEGLRQVIRDVATDAVESISYGVPTFKYKGRPLAYFGAAKNHLALYGFSIDGHEEALAGFDTAKGTIRFTPAKPLPEPLVRTLLIQRKAEIEAVTSSKRKKPTT